MAGATFGFPYAIGSAGAQAFEEQHLVEGLRDGIEEAYEVLIERYQHAVHNLVYRLLSDPSEAGDVVQDVFFKVFRNIGDFRGQSSLKTWIYRIAVNEAANQRRWFARRRKHEVGLEGESEADFCPAHVLASTELSPFEVASTHETRMLIEECLEELPPVFRSAVVLRDIEDLAYEEIAEILQISLGTVKSRIMRGREGLRKRLAAKLESLPAGALSPEPAK